MTIAQQKAIRKRLRFEAQWVNLKNLERRHGRHFGPTDLSPVEKVREQIDLSTWRFESREPGWKGGWPK